MSGTNVPGALRSAGGSRVARLALSVGAALVVATGCREATASSPLSHAAGSPEALAQAVLDAMAAEDKEAVQARLVTREEYESLLWPELPDGQYTPFSFVWGLNHANNRKGLRQLMSEWGGMRLEVVSVTFPDEPEEHQSFTIHPGVQVTVRRSDTGQEGVLPSFDVFVEYGGAWKLLNLDEL